MYQSRVWVREGRTDCRKEMWRHRLELPWLCESASLLCYLPLLDRTFLHQDYSRPNSCGHFQSGDIGTVIQTSCKSPNYTSIVPNFPTAIPDFPGTLLSPQLPRFPLRWSRDTSLCWVKDPFSLTRSITAHMVESAADFSKHRHFCDMILSLYHLERKMTGIILLIL